MSLLVSARRLKLHLLPPLLRLPPFDYYLTTTPTTFSRLFSSTCAVSPPQSFSADYLIHSCGLPSDEAVRVHNKIQHLKSPARPDAVLRFLREVGMSEPDIRTAISRNPRLLCCNMDNNLKPNVAKLREAGFSMQDISGIITRRPGLFLFNIEPKVDFWLGILGSAQNLSFALKRSGAFLNNNLEKVVVPSLSFLQQQCGLSARQIVQLIKTCPRLIACGTETLKMKAKRADQLGISRSSGTFMYALIIVSRLNQRIIDSRVNNFKSLGLSQEEVNLIVSTAPMVLGLPEELVCSKMEFLMKEADCDKIHVVRNPVLLSASLNKRLIPRNIVRKLLMSKGLPVANKKFVSIVTPTDKQFVEKYILPYERTIPGLHQAFADACAGKIRIIE